MGILGERVYLCQCEGCNPTGIHFSSKTNQMMIKASAKSILVGQELPPGKTFQKLDSEPFLPPPSFVFEKSRGWNQFDGSSSTCFRESHSSTVSHIHTMGEHMCVTSGGKVGIYSVSHNQRDKVVALRALTRFDANAFSGRLRPDAKLVCAGTDGGEIKVFDATTRSMMRTFVGHNNAVKVVRWAESGQQVWSGSNDKTVRYWDLSAERQTLLFSNLFTDHVRALSCSGSLIIAGSYDHTLQILDPRSQTSTFRAKHEFPVEDVLEVDDKFVYSASGNQISVWDIRMGGNGPVQIAVPHQKTITSLQRCGNELISASLDGSIKVLDLLSLKSLHGLFLTKKAILTVAVTENKWRMCVGSSDGELLVCTKKGPSPQEEVPLSTSQKFHMGSRKYYLRGVEITQPPQGAVMVPTDQKRPKLSAPDVHLKEFKYKLALDSALDMKVPAMTVSVLEELISRGGNALGTAIGGRDETGLEPLVSFLARFVTNPMFSRVLNQVAEEVLTCYGHQLGESVQIDRLWSKMSDELKMELNVQKKVLATMGVMEMLL